MINQSVKQRKYVSKFPMGYLDENCESIQYYIYTSGGTLIFVGKGYLYREFNENTFEVDLKDFYESIRNKNTHRMNAGLYLDESTYLTIRYVQLDSNIEEVGQQFEEDIVIDKEKMDIDGVTPFYGYSKQSIKADQLLLPSTTQRLSVYPIFKYKVYIPESQRTEPDVDFYEVVIDMFLPLNSAPSLENNSIRNLAGNDFTYFYQFGQFQTYVSSQGEEYFLNHYINKRYSHYNWGLARPGVMYHDIIRTTVLFRKHRSTGYSNWEESTCNNYLKIGTDTATFFNIYSLANIDIKSNKDSYEFIENVSEFVTNFYKLKSRLYDRNLEAADPTASEYEYNNVAKVGVGMIDYWVIEQGLSTSGSSIELVGIGYDIVATETNFTSSSFTVSGKSLTRWVDDDDFISYKPTLTFINSDVEDKTGNDLTVPLMSEIGFLKGNTSNKYTQTTFKDKYNDTYVVSAENKKTITCYVCPDWLSVTTNKNKLNYVLLKDAMYSSRLSYLQAAMKSNRNIGTIHKATAVNGLTNPDDQEIAFLYGRIKDIEEVIIPSKYTTYGENMPSLKIEFEIYE